MKKQLFKYPILSNLILYQVLAIVIGLSTLVTSYHLYSNSQEKVALNQIKAQIRPLIQTKEEEWRTWKHLELKAALSPALQDFKTKHNLNTLQIISTKILPKKLSRFQMVVPDNPQLVDLVIFAELSENQFAQSRKSNKLVLLYLLSMGALLISIVLWSSQYIKNKMYRPILKLNQVFMGDTSNYPIAIDDIAAKGEIRQFLNHVKDMHKKTQDSERMAAIGNMASQVAHDIRSPLTALKMSVAGFKDIPEEQRLLVRRAVQRIDDIANDLSSKDKSNQSSHSINSFDSSDSKSLQLISSVIDSLISEKRVQYRLNGNIDIFSDLDPKSYGLFSNINTSEFKRVLSNLINNSVEAIKTNGKIDVQLKSDKSLIYITITDNGTGISPEHLKSITNKGVSVNKPNGSGLGLHHAKVTVQSWGGDIAIASKTGQGTSITISIPRHQPPQWFLPELVITEKTTIVILDDDQTIHEIWNNRFNQIGIKDNTVKHFSSSSSFQSWYLELDNQDHNIYLFDYELIGSEKTGLDLIEAYKLYSQALLVTSRHEDIDICKICQKEGLKLLPKTQAEFLPITLKPSQSIQNQNSKEFDFVLIDDDDIVHTFWKIEAKAKSKNIMTFHSPSEFLENRTLFKPHTPIYIDANLAGEVRGEDVSHKLSKLGFKNLFIATGQDPDEIPDMAWVKDVVGKTPPFASKN